METVKIFRIANPHDASEAERVIDNMLDLPATTLKEIKTEHSTDGNYLLVVVFSRQPYKADGNTD